MGRDMELATTGEKVPEPILEAYRYKLDKFWPGEKKHTLIPIPMFYAAHTKTTVNCTILPSEQT
jgi:hypothetical protein